MRKESGEWGGAPTQEQEQLTALSAEILTLKARNKKPANNFNNRRQPKEPKDKKQPKPRKQGTTQSGLERNSTSSRKP